MHAPSVLNSRLSPMLSYVVSIAIALTLYEGMKSLINAASMPLEALAARLINAVILRGWRDIMLMPEHNYPLSILGINVVFGLVLIGMGLSVGMRILAKNGETHNVHGGKGPY